MALLNGFDDEDLDSGVVEAIKVLGIKRDAYAHAVDMIDRQYLKALEASHDGDSKECLQMLAQVRAVRALF